MVVTDPRSIGRNIADLRDDARSRRGFVLSVLAASLVALLSIAAAPSAQTQRAHAGRLCGVSPLRVLRTVQVSILLACRTDLRTYTFCSRVKDWRSRSDERTCRFAQRLTARSWASSIAASCACWPLGDQGSHQRPGSGDRAACPCGYRGARQPAQATRPVQLKQVLSQARLIIGLSNVYCCLVADRVRVHIGKA